MRSQGQKLEEIWIMSHLSTGCPLSVLQQISFSLPALQCCFTGFHHGSVWQEQGCWSQGAGRQRTNNFWLHYHIYVASGERVVQKTSKRRERTWKTGCTRQLWYYVGVCKRTQGKYARWLRSKGKKPRSLVLWRRRQRKGTRMCARSWQGLAKDTLAFRASKGLVMSSVSGRWWVREKLSTKSMQPRQTLTQSSCKWRASWHRSSLLLCSSWSQLFINANIFNELVIWISRSGLLELFRAVQM